MDFSRDFIGFSCERGVLRFGEFKTKSGRLSPYFFNAGLFNDGDALLRLCDFYARTILAANISFDVIFGPAYKGIPLAAGTAMALAQAGHNLPWCFNRKEAKDHGEGGMLIGAPLKGRVLIIDDVITAEKNMGLDPIGQPVPYRQGESSLLTAWSAAPAIFPLFRKLSRFMACRC